MNSEITFYLLDILRESAGCEYVSSLRFLDNRQMLRLVTQLDKIDAEDFLLKEWNDALSYIVNGAAQDNPNAAKAALQTSLFNKITKNAAE